MESEEYLSKYKTIQQNFFKNSLLIFHKIEDRFNNSNEGPYYFLRRSNTKFFFDLEHAKSMLYLKIFNIIQPHDILIIKDEILIISKDWSKYRLTEETLQQLSFNIIKNIILQLVITLNELSLRNIAWNLYSIKQLYFIEDCIFLQIIDLDDSHFSMNISNFEIFKNFSSKYFPQFDQIIQMDSFENIITFLLGLDQNQNRNQQNHFGLQNFFKIRQRSANIGFDDTYSIEFETPKVFEVVFGIQSQTLISKSYDQARIDSEQLLLLQNRKIGISEKLFDSSNIVINFTYIRIFKYCYFFEHKVIGNVFDAYNLLKIQQLDINSYQRIAYRALADIIKGIETFHQQGIMHRNISPQTIYIDNTQLSQAHFYIGDFDKAKEQDLTSVGTQQCEFYQYLPPERMEDYNTKTDLYLFGQVALLILNRGINFTVSTFLEETALQQQYSVDCITQQLQKNKLTYKEELIKLISACLSQNQNDRPETKDVSLEIQRINRSQKIRIVQINNQNQNR